MNVDLMLRAATYKRDPRIAEEGRALLIENMDTIIERLGTRNMRHMRIARECVLVMGEPARDRLIFILGEGHVHRRRDAAFMLGELRDPGAVDALTESLRHEDDMLRWLSAQALGKIGDPRGASALGRAARDPDDRVAAEARKALAKVQATRT
jgi:hypothetical protein